jgi:hypothetical protein
MVRFSLYVLPWIDSDRVDPGDVLIESAFYSLLAADQRCRSARNACLKVIDQHIPEVLAYVKKGIFIMQGKARQTLHGLIQSRRIVFVQPLAKNPKTE